MICKHCKSNKVMYHPGPNLYICKNCSLSSHHPEMMLKQEIGFDHLPIEELSLEAVLDEDDEPIEFIQYHIPQEVHVPELSVNVERALLLKFLLKETRREEKEFGNKWLRQNGYKVVETRQGRNHKKLYVWEKEDE